MLDNHTISYRVQSMCIINQARLQPAQTATPPVSNCVLNRLSKILRSRCTILRSQYLVSTVTYYLFQLACAVAALFLSFAVELIIAG